MPGKQGPAVDRMLGKVTYEDDGCWLFEGAKSHDGYGKLNRGGQSEGLVYAHVLAWEQAVGPIPEGMVLNHLCRVRHCVNPDHLEVTTVRGNLMHPDSLHPAAVNSRKTHCPKGHPYDEVNTYVDRTGARHCRTCGREAMRRM